MHPHVQHVTPVPGPQQPYLGGQHRQDAPQQPTVCGVQRWLVHEHLPATSFQPAHEPPDVRVAALPLAGRLQAQVLRSTAVGPGHRTTSV